MKPRILKWLGEPDRIIGENYLDRWYLVPRNRFCNVYLHRFTGSDGRVLHDHPWWSISFLLSGSYYEEVNLVWSYHRMVGQVKWLERIQPRKFVPYYRSAEHMHRIVVESPEVWTLFITGPKRREWGFLLPTGWVHWKAYREMQRQGEV